MVRHPSLEHGSTDNTRHVHQWLFMFLFDLTPDHAASEAHTSLPENGNIGIELQFSGSLPEAIT